MEVLPGLDVQLTPVPRRRITTPIILIALTVFFFVLGFIFLLIRSSRAASTTTAITTVLVATTPTPTGSLWLTFTNVERSFSIEYPPYWILGASSANNPEICSGPVFYTSTGHSWMTVCQIDDPTGLLGQKQVWSGKTEVLDKFFGGHTAIQFEYKQQADQYDYYAFVENKSQNDLLRFHLRTDVAEKVTAKSIFDKILVSSNFF